jgi:predicted dehydrogenase
MNNLDPTRPLSIAFLGCGAVTRLHSRTLASMQTPVRRFYASRDPSRAQAYDSHLRGSGWFNSYEAAIDHGEIQTVLVATPPSGHLDLTLRALEAGKHVIVEKPAFLSSEDFAMVREAVSRSGRRVFVAENYFYKPLTRRLREILASGCLGDIRFVHLNALKEQETGDWRDDPALAGGGALFEGGIHWVCLLANMGLDVVELWGSKAGAGSGPERSVLVVARFGQGAVGTLQYSWEIRAPVHGLRISRVFGTRGSLVFESNGLFLLRRRGRGAAGWIFPRIELPGLRDLLGYRAMFGDFLRAIETCSDPEYTLHLAEADIRRTEMIYRKMTGSSGCPCKL